MSIVTAAAWTLTVCLFAILGGAQAPDPTPAAAERERPGEVSAVAVSPAPAPSTETEPSIELVTMGAGGELFTRWGHAALCVAYRRSPERGICYNYGAAFPTSAAALAWQFLRGTARFMVIEQRYDEMLSIYQREDRSVWVQRLPFSQAQVDRMVGLLENDLLEENRTYVYHHMWDNCATRLRDHMDRVLEGRMKAGGQGGTGVTYRTLAQRGLTGRPLLVVGTTLAFGRGLDEEVTAWASMGHPDFLRRETERQLGVKPEALYLRVGPPLPERTGAGHGYLLGLAILLGVGALLSRRELAALGGGRLARPGRAFAFVAKGLLVFLGVLLWCTALVTTVRELWLNEALCVFLPTDVMLFLAKGHHFQWYLRARLVGLVVVGILLAAEVFVQPLFSALLVPGLICLALVKSPLMPRAAPPSSGVDEAHTTQASRGRKKRQAGGPKA